MHRSSVDSFDSFFTILNLGSRRLKKAGHIIMTQQTDPTVLQKTELELERQTPCCVNATTRLEFVFTLTARESTAYMRIM